MKRIQFSVAAIFFCVATAFFPFRLCAAEIVWTNIAGGNWNLAANWSPNQVPGAEDDVFITNSGTYTVRLNVAAAIASFTLGGASGTQTFTNSAQTLTVNGSGTVNTNGLFGMSGGTLAGAGDFTAYGPFIWNSGTISGAGRVFANGGLTLSGTGSKSLSARTLVNGGAGTWNAGTIFLASGAILSNAVTGTFDCAFDGNISNGGGTGQAVQNAGLFRKTSGAGTANSSVAFNNAGMVEVQSGTLNLSGGGTHTGDFACAAGTTNNLGGGTHHLAAGNITGAGTFVVSGGTANFAGTLGLTSRLNVSAGTANFNGSGLITPSQLNVTGTLGGSNNLNVLGAMIWTGGTISGSGSVTASGGLTIVGTGAKSLAGRTLVNAGTAVWSEGVIFLVNGGILSNAVTGTFDCAFDGNISSGGGVGQIVANAGLFRKTGGTNTTSSVLAFNNAGTVEIQTGTLNLNGGGTDTGEFILPPAPRSA